MSESKGKILFVILAVLLLLFGGGMILYPSLNGLLVERTMHRDSEDFLLLLEEDAERTAEENSHVIPGEPGTSESVEPQLPLEAHPTLAGYESLQRSHLPGGAERAVRPFCL